MCLCVSEGALKTPDRNVMCVHCVVRRKLCVFAVDECHYLKRWGANRIASLLPANLFSCRSRLLRRLASKSSWFRAMPEAITIYTHTLTHQLWNLVAIPAPSSLSIFTSFVRFVSYVICLHKHSSPFLCRYLCSAFTAQRTFRFLLFYIFFFFFFPLTHSSLTCGALVVVLAGCCARVSFSLSVSLGVCFIFRSVRIRSLNLHPTMLVACSLSAWKSFEMSTHMGYGTSSTLHIYEKKCPHRQWHSIWCVYNV